MHICIVKPNEYVADDLPGAYLIVMGLGMGVYYGWWLYRFYPGLRAARKGAAARQWVLGKKRKNEAEEKPVFLPALAGELMDEVEGFFEKVKTVEMEGEELMTELRGLVGDERFAKLRGTLFHSSKIPVIAPV